MFGRLSREQAARAGVQHGEKVITWGRVAPSDDATVVVATDQALYLDPAQRLPWMDISRASWEEPFLELTLTPGTMMRNAPGRIRSRIEDARDLPRAVNAKVTESVVVSERIELDTGVVAQFVARRDNDAIVWSVIFESGADPRDPALRASADRALAELRDALGI